MNFAFCIVSAHAQSLVPVGARQLVMPFENGTREARYNWLSEGVSLALTDDLVALGAEALSRNDRLRAFERLRVPPVATISEATIIRIGQIVGAEQVIVGSFTLANGMLSIHATAIRLDTGRRFPEIVQTGPLSDFFALFASVARRLLPDSTVSATDLERVHPSLAAFEEFVKGSLAENPATQVVFLKEALRYAPDYQRARLALWSAYTDQAAHSQALDVARQVPADSPLAREARFDAALSLVQLGRHTEAIDEFQALNRQKRDAALLNDAGVAQLRRTAASPDGSSADFFRQAIAADPADPDLAFNLGYSSWLSHDTVNAITWLREAVRRNPADDAAHWVLGVALEASSNAAEGQREKELAERLSSKYAEWDRRQPGTRAIPPSLERLKTNLDAGASSRVDAAIAAAEQRDQRDTATFHLESARRLYDAHRDADAVAELRRVIYLSPYDPDAHLLLGRLYLRGGRIADAIDELKISIWSDDRTDARMALAEAYINAKNPDSARSEIQTILTREPSNAAAIALREKIEAAH